jgi:ATP-dependent RNA helicase DDX35
MADIDTFIPSLHTPSSLLPIARHKDALLYTVESNQITILVGQTGSGKTTQLPQYLEQAGWCNEGKVIAVTQASLQSTLRLRRFRCLDVDILQIP